MQRKSPINGKDLEELFIQVKLGNLQVLKVPYETYKAEFMSFCTRYGASQDDILDAYQDAFVALVENIQHKGIATLRSGLKTYLFSIAKFLLFKKLKRLGKQSDFSEELALIADEQSEISYYSNLTDQQKLLRAGLETLGAKCRELIRLFYYRQLSINEIMEVMGYKNENSVKANKSRCMKTLWQKIMDTK